MVDLRTLTGEERNRAMRITNDPWYSGRVEPQGAYLSGSSVRSPGSLSAEGNSALEACIDDIGKGPFASHLRSNSVDFVCTQGATDCPWSVTALGKRGDGNYICDYDDRFVAEVDVSLPAQERYGQLFAWGIFYKASKDPERAIGYFEEALELAPERKVVTQVLIPLYRETGREMKARRLEREGARVIDGKRKLPAA